MTELQIAGTIESALTHMALVGLAAIIEDRTRTRPRIRWTEDWPSRATVTCGLTTDEIAESVRSHAQAHSEPDSWVTMRVVGGPRDGTGLFAPRAVGMTDQADWRAYLAQRRVALVGLMRTDSGAPQTSGTTESGGDPPAHFRSLDDAMLVGLGETGWWLLGSKRRRPDDGASRWEMKTRNRGEEFIRDRLSHLAARVAARSLTEVGEGLAGRKVIDEAGKNAVDSRSSTGLTTPGPTDNAIAWCAL
jgi:CRISPR-associated protein Csb3